MNVDVIFFERVTPVYAVVRRSRHRTLVSIDSTKKVDSITTRYWDLSVRTRNVSYSSLVGLGVKGGVRLQ